MVENTFSISRNSNRYPIFYLAILLSFSFVFLAFILKMSLFLIKIDSEIILLIPKEW